MALRSRLIRGAGVTAGGFLLSRLISFGAYVAIASLITPAEAGRFTAGSLFAGVAVLFAESGMLGAIIQWRDDVDEAASTAFFATLANGVALTGLGVAVAPLIGMFFHSGEVRDIAFACSGFLLLGSLQVVPDALLQRRFSFVRRVAVDPLGALVFAIVAIVACSDGMGAWGLVLGTYALLATQVLVAWAFVRWRPRRRQASFATWRRLAGFGRHIVASEILRRTTGQLDSLALGRFAGAAPLGQYSYGLRLAAQPAAAFVSVVAYVLLPAFARMSHDAERFRRSILDSLAVLGVLSFPLALLLIPTGDQLALLAFGPRWGGAGDAIKALCLVSVGWTWVSLGSEVFKAANRPQLVARVHLVSLAVSVPAILALVSLDEVGVGLAVSAAAMASGTYALARTAEIVELRLSRLLAPMLPTLVAALAGLAAAGLVDVLAFSGGHEGRGGALVAILAETAAMVLVYLPALRAVSPADARRLAEMTSALRRRRAPVEVA